MLSVTPGTTSTTSPEPCSTALIVTRAESCASSRSIRLADRHPPRWLGERREAVLRIEPVRVTRREHEVTQILQLGMRDDRVHQQLRHTLAAMRREDEHIAEPRPRRLVGHDRRVPRDL